jgi:hypothetical protein
MSPSAPTCPAGSNARHVERKGKKRRKSERTGVGQISRERQRKRKANKKEMSKNGKEKGRENNEK